MSKKYVAKYFTKTKEIAEKFHKDSTVLIQFFQRRDNVMLCGMNEVLEFLKKNTDFNQYKIRYIEEGSIIDALDVVLELEGPYQYFGEYEGVIDGILARSTSVATNAKEAVLAANGKHVIFMGDRSDHYSNQERDGYAVSIGGVKTQVTDAHVELHEGVAIGTVPHVLIQMFDGDIVKALSAYDETHNEEKLVALVDFNNDVINDTLKVLEKFKERLSAIRIDTSPNMSDAYFKNNEEFGVTPNLVKATRKALDANNGRHVKIIISSGLTAEKIKNFEIMNSPVDYYGVGSAMIKVWANFSADAVRFNEKLISKKGRGYKQNMNLKTLIN